MKKGWYRRRLPKYKSYRYKVHYFSGNILIPQYICGAPVDFALDKSCNYDPETNPNRENPKFICKQCKRNYKQPENTWDSWE